jgi:hypothetical protein
MGEREDEGVRIEHGAGRRQTGRVGVILIYTPIDGCSSQCKARKEWNGLERIFGIAWMAMSQGAVHVAWEVPTG